MWVMTFRLPMLGDGCSLSAFLALWVWARAVSMYAESQSSSLGRNSVLVSTISNIFTLAFLELSLHLLALLAPLGEIWED